MKMNLSSGRLWSSATVASAVKALESGVPPEEVHEAVIDKCRENGWPEEDVLGRIDAQMNSEEAQRATIAKRLLDARDIVDECRAMAKHVHLDLLTLTAIFKCESALTAAIEEVSPLTAATY
jgi:hypothetical protein